MGIATIPAPSASGKTRYVETLTSGTSWTVPAGVTYVNVTLLGAGQQGISGTNYAKSDKGNGGSMIQSTVATTPGASISYAIGAGGGGTGGTTTFTGATSAVGGSASNVGPRGNNGGQGGDINGSGQYGGNGSIFIEYWL